MTRRDIHNELVEAATELAAEVDAQLASDPRVSLEPYRVVALDILCDMVRHGTFESDR